MKVIEDGVLTQNSNRINSIIDSTVSASVCSSCLVVDDGIDSE